MKMNNTFKTKDLSLATTINLYKPIEAIDCSDELRIEFIFERDDSLDELVQRYWRYQMMVEPQAYFQKLRQLKTRIYEARKYK
jgi:hypothetical protein